MMMHDNSQNRSVQDKIPLHWWIILALFGLSLGYIVAVNPFTTDSQNSATTAVATQFPTNSEAPALTRSALGITASTDIIPKKPTKIGRPFWITIDGKTVKFTIDQISPALKITTDLVVDRKLRRDGKWAINYQGQFIFFVVDQTDNEIDIQTYYEVIL